MGGEEITHSEEMGMVPYRYLPLVDWSDLRHMAFPGICMQI